MERPTVDERLLTRLTQALAPRDGSPPARACREPRA